jgi:hypothetical protein
VYALRGLSLLPKKKKVPALGSADYSDVNPRISNLKLSARGCITKSVLMHTRHLRWMAGANFGDSSSDGGAATR